MCLMSRIKHQSTLDSFSEFRLPAAHVAARAAWSASSCLILQRTVRAPVRRAEARRRPSSVARACIPPQFAAQLRAQPRWRRPWLCAPEQRSVCLPCTVPCRALRRAPACACALAPAPRCWPRRGLPAASRCVARPLLRRVGFARRRRAPSRSHRLRCSSRTRTASSGSTSSAPLPPAPPSSCRWCAARTPCTFRPTQAEAGAPPPQRLRQPRRVPATLPHTSAPCAAPRGGIASRRAACLSDSPRPHLAPRRRCCLSRPWPRWRSPSWPSSSPRCWWRPSATRCAAASCA